MVADAIINAKCEWKTKDLQIWGKFEKGKTRVQRERERERKNMDEKDMLEKKR